MRAEDLKKLEGKEIRIVTKGGLNYHTDSLRVIDDETIGFYDKYGSEILLSSNMIAIISVIGGNGNEK